MRPQPPKPAIPLQGGPEYGQVVFLTEKCLELPEIGDLSARAGDETFEQPELVKEHLHPLAPTVKVWRPASRLGPFHRFSRPTEGPPEDGWHVC